MLLTSHFLDGRLALETGVFLGNGETTDDNDGKELTGRLGYSLLNLPDRGSKPLIVAVAAITNGHYGSPRDTLLVASGDTLMIRDPKYGAAFEGWVEYGRYSLPGLHVAANVIVGDNAKAFRIAGDRLTFPTFLGLQSWGEYRIPTGYPVLTDWAPAYRIDRFDPNTGAGDDVRWLLTPGLNLYFGPTVKVQANYDVSVPENVALEAESATPLVSPLFAVWTMPRRANFAGAGCPGATVAMRA